MQLIPKHTRIFLLLGIIIFGASLTARAQDSPIVVSGSSLTAWSLGGFATNCSGTGANDLCVSQSGKTARSIAVFNSKKEMLADSSPVGGTHTLSPNWQLHVGSHNVHLSGASQVTIHAAAGSWGPEITNDPDLMHGHKHSNGSTMSSVTLDNSNDANCPGGHCTVRCPSGTCWIKIHYR